MLRGETAQDCNSTPCPQVIDDHAESWRQHLRITKDDVNTFFRDDSSLREWSDTCKLEEEARVREKEARDTREKAEKEWHNKCMYERARGMFVSGGSLSAFSWWLWGYNPMIGIALMITIVCTIYNWRRRR